MAASSEPSLQGAFRHGSLTAGAIAMVVASVDLVGWLSHDAALTFLFPGWTPMYPSTAIALFGAGLSLCFWWKDGRCSKVLAMACALIPIVIGLWTICSYVLGVGPRPDTWLIQHIWPESRFQASRMAPNTAITAILDGVALLLIGRKRRWINPSRCLALVTGCLALVALIGYSYSAIALYRIGPYAPMAFATALTLLDLSVGIALSRPEGGFIGRLARESPGGLLLRHLLLPFLMAPIVLGWAIHYLADLGLYDGVVADALFTLVTIALPVPLISRLGRTMDATAAERERFEAALQESEARLRTIVEHTTDAIFIKDLEGRYVFVNPGTTAFFGRSQRDILGKTAIELMGTVLGGRITENDQAVLASKRLQMQEEVIVNSAGAERDFLTIKFPYVSGEGPLIGLIGIGRDITEQKRAIEAQASHAAELQKALELAQLKDHFLSMISHEMKTPLSLIIGYLELLEEKYPDEELISGLREGSQRLTSHINDILDYSALIGGSLPLFKTEINLPELVSNAILTVRGEFEIKGVRLETELAGPFPHVEADPRRLTQVLVELLDNARKFTPSGAKVGIRAQPAGEGIRIEVWDTGYGIAAGDAHRIWEPFTQIEHTSAFRAGGLGLGLCISKKLIELHGGSLTLDSQPGRGSRFYIELPALHEPS